MPDLIVVTIPPHPVPFIGTGTVIDVFERRRGFFDVLDGLFGILGGFFDVLGLFFDILGRCGFFPPPTHENGKVRADDTPQRVLVGRIQCLVLAWDGESPIEFQELRADCLLLFIQACQIVSVIFCASVY